MDIGRFTAPSGSLEPRRSPLGREYWCFVPDVLPPQTEELAVAQAASLLADATHALGQLDGIGTFLPNPDLLVRPYMRREAVLSSRIEGTKTSFSDLIAFEATEQRLPAGDVRGVHNYVVALDFGLRHVHDAGITADLARALHRQLLAGVRGEDFGTPGEFRTMQNHIGGTNDIADATFVPPSPDEMHSALEAFFGYLAQAKPATPVLVEGAWMHYQFETIHPFLDGNGRVGRALIPLLLAWRQRLAHPLLYLSPYFESHREAYYDRLFAVSAKSDWAGWLRFFLEAVLHQAKDGVALARKIVQLGTEWHDRLDAVRATRTAHRLVDVVHQRIAIDARTAERELEVSTQTAYKAIESLASAGIVEEFTGRAWGRVYLAPELLDLLEAAG